MPRDTRFPGSRLMRTPAPGGYGMRFTVLDDNSIYVRYVFDEYKEGPPGHAHGGAVATVLDEAMGTAAFESERLGYTATMTVNYRASVPLGVEVEVRARVIRTEGSKTWVTAEITLPDGRIAADSSGLFIMSQALLERLIARRQAEEGNTDSES